MNSLIKNYLSGRSTFAEHNQLLEWIRKNDNLAGFQSIKNDWKVEIADEDISPEYYQVWQGIQNSIFDQMRLKMRRTERTLNIFRYAAIFFLLLSVPSLIYYTTRSQTQTPSVYTTVAADFGQISKVVLPDSSIIWVNSGSMIKYNNQFSVTNRDIELIGEAFFKVKRNPEVPLVVSNSNLHVKVLGTEFSISAYPEDSNIQVVLEKGNVELSYDKDNYIRQELKPGELASFNKKESKLTKLSVNTKFYTSWKDGLINIYNLPLNELIIKLEKRYNQKFIVDKAIKNIPYTFTIKNEDFSSVLSLIEKITPIDVIQHGNVIELRSSISKKSKINQ